MNSVFVLQHVHRLPDGSDDVKMVGVYRSRTLAEAAVSRLCGQPGFRDFPGVVDYEADSDEQGFHINEYELDLDHWAEGYVTV